MVSEEEPTYFSPRTHPVTFLPTETIFENPTLSLCINRQWIPFILGVLEPLTLPDYWPNMDTAFSDQVERLQMVLLKDSFNSLCDEQGNIQVPSEWLHTFDFTIDEQGWTGYPESWAGGPAAVYNSGVGWGVKTAIGYNYSTVEIQSPLISGGFEITSVIVNYQIGSVVPEGAFITLNSNTNVVSNMTIAANEALVWTYVADLPGTTRVMVFLNRSFAPLQDGSYVTRVEITGKGTDPF